jgi:hypothetical protein
MATKQQKRQKRRSRKVVKDRIALSNDADRVGELMKKPRRSAREQSELDGHLGKLGHLSLLAGDSGVPRTA